MSTIPGWSFTEGTDLFRGAQAGDGIGGISAFLYNNVWISIATAE